MAIGVDLESVLAYASTHGELVVTELRPLATEPPVEEVDTTSEPSSSAAGRTRGTMLAFAPASPAMFAPASGVVVTDCCARATLW